MSTTPSLSWEEPADRGAYDWAGIASQLEARPMEWAKVFDRDRQSLAVAIRVRGITALWPEKGFEVRTRNNVRRDVPVPVCTMYLRYNPTLDTRVSASVATSEES